MTESIQKAYLESPIGIVEITGSHAGIRSVSFTELEKIPKSEIPASLLACHHQLREYFEGSRKEFSLLIDPLGTEFQQEVWKLLSSIRHGERTSYKDQALAYGDLKAIRAVAAANAKNPIAVIIPCHRVVGSDGSLTGYAGALWRKKWLLDHETPPAQTSLF